MPIPRDRTLPLRARRKDPRILVLANASPAASGASKLASDFGNRRRGQKRRGRAGSPLFRPCLTRFPDKTKMSLLAMLLSF